jgi:hypothetical protein
MRREVGMILILLLFLRIETFSKFMVRKEYAINQEGIYLNKTYYWPPPPPYWKFWKPVYKIEASYGNQVGLKDYILVKRLDTVISYILN